MYKYYQRGRMYGLTSVMWSHSAVLNRTHNFMSWITFNGGEAKRLTSTITTDEKVEERLSYEYPHNIPDLFKTLPQSVQQVIFHSKEGESEIEMMQYPHEKAENLRSERMADGGMKYNLADIGALESLGVFIKIDNPLHNITHFEILYGEPGEEMAPILVKGDGDGDGGEGRLLMVSKVSAYQLGQDMKALKYGPKISGELSYFRISEKYYYIPFNEPVEPEDMGARSLDQTKIKHKTPVNFVRRERCDIILRNSTGASLDYGQVDFWIKSTNVYRTCGSVGAFVYCW